MRQSGFAYIVGCNAGYIDELLAARAPFTLDVKDVACNGHARFGTIYGCNILATSVGKPPATPEV